MSADHEMSAKTSLEDDFESAAATSDDSRTRLLEDHLSDEEKQEVDPATPKLQRHAPWDRKWLKLALLLMFITALLATTIRFLSLKKSDLYSGPPNSNHDEISTTWRRDPDDYVLSPEWDFNAPPQTREYHWTVQDTEINPDGVYRPMMVVNNQFPGPLVRANEGDTIKVTVKNKAVNATSIHWHGLFQNGTNLMDGTVGITQCPIAPGQSFVYEFKVEGQSGTYWWHGHQGVQSSDGLHGPLIIHGRQEKELQKIHYTTDRIVMLSDHYHDLSGALSRQYLAPDRENAEPVPDGALINGKGIRDCSTVPHRRCDNTTEGVVTPRFDLLPNTQHRLRIINVGAFAEFQFQIDEHELAITEVDGTDVLPMSYHRLNINPAQRYSVVVNTSVTSADSFWMRARMIPHCFTDIHPYLETDVNAVVRYTREDLSHKIAPIPTRELEVQPTSKDWGEGLWVECRDLNTTELRPAQAVAAPTKEDAFHYIRSNFEIGDWRLSRGFFNTSTWRPTHRSPSLHRLVGGLNSGNASYTGVGVDPTSISNTPSSFVNDRAFDPKNEFVIQTEGIVTIDVLIHNFDDGNHPMHLHGYKFFVLAQGHGSPPRLDNFRPPSDRENLQPLYDSLDLSNPLRRDTASVEAYGWVLLRFVADNPGAWALHCHVSWHTEAGLLMQFMTRTDQLRGLSIPEEQKALCSAEGVELGAAPKDDDFIAEAKGG